MTDPVRLYVGAPVLNGWCHASQILGYTQLGRLYPDLQLVFTTDSAICRGRNDISARFLEDPKATHLLFIDSDIGGWTGEDVRRMVDTKLDLVSAIYRIKVAEERYAANIDAKYQKHVPALVHEGQVFLEMQDLPTGFMLIRRNVLEAMRERCKEIRYRATEDGTPHPGDRWNFFEMRVEQESERYLTEDYFFVRRWQRLGGKAYAYLGARLIHFGTQPFVADYDAYLRKNGVEYVIQDASEVDTNPATPVGLTRQQRRALERQGQAGVNLVRSPR